MRKPSGKVIAVEANTNISPITRETTQSLTIMYQILFDRFSDIPDDIKEQLPQLVDETVSELDFEVSQVYVR